MTRRGLGRRRRRSGGGEPPPPRWRRIHADKLRDRVEAWESPAVDRPLARALAALAGDHVVLHDVVLSPGGRPVEHVVIGPGGVHVIGTAQLDPRVHVTERTGGLWRGHYPVRREAGQVRADARAVRDLVDEANGVVCFVEDNLRPDVVRLDDLVTAVNLSCLVEHLRTGAHALDPGDIAALADRLTRDPDEGQPPEPRPAWPAPHVTPGWMVTLDPPGAPAPE